MKRALTSAVLVAAILAGSPDVRAANVKQLGHEDVKGCWTRILPDDRAGLDLRRDESGNAYIVLSANSETGEEFRALVPAFQVCFLDSGRIAFVVTSGEDSLEASGSYVLHATQIEVVTDNIRDAWPFASRASACNLTLANEVLVVSQCQDDDGRADAAFGEQHYARAVEYVDY